MTYSPTSIKLTQHGKEIETDNNLLMEEIFDNFLLMTENHIDEDQIEKYFLATHKEVIIGFLAVGYCGRTVLIEVSEQGKGIGNSLIKFAVKQGYTRAWLPKQNGCFVKGLTKLN